ncbi:MAG: helix-turn-helix transcriptional regulator [candidate division Zixibacteria bacterium]|nr:helix-turn-helix transcriptional regulator [candidate division Zixibacteria bacterium]MCH9024896.1 helix-turn-helix transcriptional regulator [candidate division Zixibacteria bacterium]
MDTKQYSKYFKAFSDRSRLRILGLLAGKEMTVNEIVAVVGLSQSTVSRHLSVLRDSGIVDDRRDGQMVICSLNKEAIKGCCMGFCDCFESPKKSKKKRK